MRHAALRADRQTSAADVETETLDTRTKLILAAERLFGDRGIDAVPLADIVAAAGQRNTSALQYHIGGREQLITAILEYRRATVDARRLELLDSYANAGVTMNEGAIAAGIIIPLVELMLSDPRGGNYLCFLSQAFLTERPAATYHSIAQNDRGLRRCHRLYRARHPNIPSRLLVERFTLCVRGVFYALADWQRDSWARRSSVPRSALPGFAVDLITINARALSSVRGGEHRFVPFAVPGPCSDNSEVEAAD
jgi:AcrR family transcriptional regulator